MKSEQEEQKERKLTYLSETLADALQDMEDQQKLKEFTLSNSARAELNFLDGSLKLDKLRMVQRSKRIF